MFILFVGFYFGKIWKIWEKWPFFRVDMAGLGSIGLNKRTRENDPRNLFYTC